MKRYILAVASLNKVIADLNCRILLARLETGELTTGNAQQILHAEFVCPITAVPLDAPLVVSEELAELSRFYAAVSTLKDTLSSFDFEVAPAQRPAAQ